MHTGAISAPCCYLFDSKLTYRTMTQALDALDKYLNESAYDLGAKRPEEFTAQDYIEMMLAKHGRVVKSTCARYKLNQDVKDGKLNSRRIGIDGKFMNLYSVTETQKKTRQ